MDGPPQPRKLTQVVAGVVATLGAFSLGNVLGWGAPSHEILKKEGFSAVDQGHILSVPCLGAAFAQVYTAFTIDRIGRKWSIIVISIPAIGVWPLLGSTSNFYVYLIARFFTGFCGGTFCVVAPVYIGEYADKAIRGPLLTMFNLFIVAGIVMSFAGGLLHSKYAISYPMAIPPAVCLVSMIFLPESPIFLLRSGDEEKARKSLAFFRGKSYYIEPDLVEMKIYIADMEEGNFMESMKHKYVQKGFLVVLVLHLIQQWGGIDGVVFNITAIFGMNGDLCISILHPPVDDPQSGELPCERWNPTQNVRTILLSVISLLNEPNTFSPANVDASVMYRRWRDSKGRDKEYENIIRKQAMAARAEAERDGIQVPLTLEDYCIKTQVKPNTSDSQVEMTDFYDDDYDEDYDDLSDGSDYEEDENDSGNGES